MINIRRRAYHATWGHAQRCLAAGFIDFADKDKGGPTAEIDYEELLGRRHAVALTSACGRVSYGRDMFDHISLLSSIVLYRMYSSCVLPQVRTDIHAWGHTLVLYIHYIRYMPKSLDTSTYIPPHVDTRSRTDMHTCIHAQAYWHRSLQPLLQTRVTISESISLPCAISCKHAITCWKSTRQDIVSLSSCRWLVTSQPWIAIPRFGRKTHWFGTSPYHSISVWSQLFKARSIAFLPEDNDRFAMLPPIKSDQLWLSSTVRGLEVGRTPGCLLEVNKFKECTWIYNGRPWWHAWPTDGVLTSERGLH